MIRIIALTIGLYLVPLPPPASASSDPEGPGWSSRLDKDSARVEARLTALLQDSSANTAARRTRRQTVAYRPVCASADPARSPGFLQAETCDTAASFCPPEDGGPRTPMWVMVRPPIPSPGPDDWIPTGDVTCRSPARGQPELTVQQFRRLPIPAPRIVAQPDPAIRHTLINIPTNLYTSGEPLLLHTTILGRQVTVRATPSAFHWQYGDGEELTTAEPGSPYPVMPTAHTYTEPGAHTVRLTSTFIGEYSVAAGPWQPVQGTAILASRPLSITAEESRAVLVS